MDPPPQSKIIDDFIYWLNFEVPWVWKKNCKACCLFVIKAQLRMFPGLFFL